MPDIDHYQAPSASERLRSGIVRIGVWTPLVGTLGGAAIGYAPYSSDPKGYLLIGALVLLGAAGISISGFASAANGARDLGRMIETLCARAESGDYPSEPPEVDRD